MKKVVLVCGLIGGGMAAAMMMAPAVYYGDGEFHGSMVYGYVSMLLAFSMVFVGIKSYRENYNDGTVSFGKAFRIGLYIALIASTIYVITWLIAYYFFFPDYMDKYAAHVLKDLPTKGLNQAQIAEQVKQMDNMKQLYKNPLMVILFTYLEILPVGLLVSLISAAILKRKSRGSQKIVTA